LARANVALGNARCLGRSVALAFAASLESGRAGCLERNRFALRKATTFDLGDALGVRLDVDVTARFDAGSGWGRHQADRSQSK
jgi:hypothetical protein